MSIVSDAVQRVFMSGGEVFIPAVSRENQESLRTMTFQVRKKLPEKYRDEIGISKVREADGSLAVRVYKREVSGLMERDPATGLLVPLKSDPVADEDQDLVRQVTLMRKDGVAEEEIQKVIAEWNKE